jgi:DNA-binding transcriptional LysR family regulator
MIELRHFRYFVAVAEEGHVTRAAARLGIQQPPLSQQIRALEREVGAQLFRRLPRGVELTDAGRTLLEKVRLVLSDVELALDAARRTARGEQGGLVIGFTSSAAFHPLVASVVRLLRQTVPGAQLSMTGCLAFQASAWAAQSRSSSSRSVTPAGRAREGEACWKGT